MKSACATMAVVLMIVTLVEGYTLSVVSSVDITTLAGGTTGRSAFTRIDAKNLSPTDIFVIGSKAGVSAVFYKCNMDLTTCQASAPVEVERTSRMYSISATEFGFTSHQAGFQQLMFKVHRKSDLGFFGGVTRCCDFDSSSSQASVWTGSEAIAAYIQGSTFRLVQMALPSTHTNVAALGSTGDGRYAEMELDSVRSHIFVCTRTGPNEPLVFLTSDAGAIIDSWTSAGSAITANSRASSSFDHATGTLFYAYDVGGSVVVASCSETGAALTCTETDISAASGSAGSGASPGLYFASDINRLLVASNTPGGDIFFHLCLPSLDSCQTFPSTGLSGLSPEISRSVSGTFYVAASIASFDNTIVHAFTLAAPVPLPPPPPPRPPPPPPPSPPPPLETIAPPSSDGAVESDVEEDVLPAGAATSTASLALYMVIGSVAVILVSGIWVRRRRRRAFREHPESWVGLHPLEMIVTKHTLTGLLRPKPGDPLGRLARSVTGLLSLSVLAVVTVILPYLRPTSFDSSAGIFTLERLADTAFASVLSTLISGLLGIPLLNKGLSSPDPTARRAALIVGIVTVAIIVFIGATLFLLPIFVSAFPFQPAQVGMVILVSIGWQLGLTEPALALLTYYALSDRAIFVLYGGNGAVPGSATIHPSPGESTELVSKLGHDPGHTVSVSVSGSGSGSGSGSDSLSASSSDLESHSDMP